MAWLCAGAIALGFVVGSFLNVCIYRLPRNESLAWPASHCPICAAPIKGYDNIPLISYLLLNARCRACQQPISIQYPIVEAGNGIGYGLILWQFDVGWPTIVYAALFSALLVIAWIDFSHQIIPDRITLPGIVVGLLCSGTILPVGFLNSVLGVMVGGGILWVLAWLSPYLFGKEGMGGGDIKLLAMIGAFLGWKPAVLTVLIGSLMGSITGIGLMMFKMMKKDEYLPFGPFLALGAVVSMFFHHKILDWYLGFLIGTQ